MGLGRVMKTSTGNGSLLRLIEQQYTRDDLKPFMDADTSYIRASSIPNLCAREEVLCGLHQFKRPDIVDAALNLTFLHGTALHWAVQNKLLGPMGVLYGTWRCDSCKAVYGKQSAKVRHEEWSVPCPKACTACGGDELTYIEPSFKDDTYRLTGHTDGYLVLPGLPGMGILEVKSVGPRYAREIRQAPQVGHVIQAHVYMMFTGFQWARILYWAKAEAGMSMLAEHHVERDEETIARVQNMARSVWNGLRGGELPERICATATCPRAGKCLVADKCFA